MNVEDRLRAATRARAGLVRGIRPLELPDQAPSRARRAARAWGGWLGPVAAAAAVIAVAVSLVTVRHAAAPPAPAVSAASPLPAAAAAVRAKVPRYYAVISQDAGSNRDYQGNPARDFSIVDDRAGKTVYSFQAPGAGYLDSVSASDDDKTFILTIKDDSGGVHWTVDKIHLSAHPGGKLTFSLATIAVTGVDNAEHLDTYLDPSGTELAVVAERVTGTTVQTTVQSYHGTESPPSSGPLRTWTTTRTGAPSIGFFRMNSTQSVLFSTPAPGAAVAGSPAYSQVRSLNTTSPSGDLIARSHQLFSGPAPCAAATVINNGLTAVCGARVASNGKPGTSCANGSLSLSAYDFESPAKRQGRALASYPLACDAGTAVPLWATTGVKDVVAQLTVTSGRSSQTMLAVAAGGRLYGLPLPVTPVSGGTAIAF